MKHIKTSEYKNIVTSQFSYHGGGGEYNIDEAINLRKTDRGCNLVFEERGIAISLPFEMCQNINRLCDNCSINDLSVNVKITCTITDDYDPGRSRNLPPEQSYPPSGGVEIEDASVVVQLTNPLGQSLDFVLPENINDKIYNEFREKMEQELVRL